MLLDEKLSDEVTARTLTFLGCSRHHLVKLLETGKLNLLK